MKRLVLAAVALALAIAACERVVVLTPGYDAGFDGAIVDSDSQDGGANHDGGALPDAFIGDAF